MVTEHNLNYMFNMYIIIDYITRTLITILLIINSWNRLMECRHVLQHTLMCVTWWGYGY